MALIGVLLAAGCRRGGPRPVPDDATGPDGGADVSDLTRPSAVAEFAGEVSRPRFTADSRALFGYARAGMSPDGRSLDYYGFWDVATGKELRQWSWSLRWTDTIQSHEPGTADGMHWLALGSLKGSTPHYQFIEFDPEPRLSEVPGAGPHKAATRPSFSRDFGRMAYADDRSPEHERRAHVLARQGDTWTRLLSVAGQDACLSPDGGRLVTIHRAAAPADLTVIAWSVPDGKKLWTTPCPGSELHGFTADGKYVAQGAQGKWWLYDAATGEVRLTFQTEARFLAAYAGGRVLTATQRRLAQGVLLETWDAATGRALGQRELPAGATLARTENESFTTPRLAVILGAGERRGGHTVSTAEVYDPGRADPVATLTVSDLSYVLVSPDGSVAAALTGDGPRFYHLTGP
jgi:hypothetical protein